MPEDNSNVTGAPAHAAEVAAAFKTPEAISQWMLSLIHEWKERDGKVYAIAFGGNRVAEQHEDGSIEASIFEAIQDQVMDTHFATELEAGLLCLDKLAKSSGKGEAHD